MNIFPNSTFGFLSSFACRAEVRRRRVIRLPRRSQTKAGHSPAAPKLDVGGSLTSLSILLAFATTSSSLAATNVEQWGTFELSLNGPTNGNPFLDVRFGARFYQDDTVIETA